MSNSIEVEALLDLVRFAGPGAASRLAEGRSIFTPEDQVDLVVGRALMEALSGYENFAPAQHWPQLSALTNMPDGIHNHSRAEEPVSDELARQFLDKSVAIGELLPRLQLAIREAQTMEEKAGIVAVLDRALDAHRELSDWCSRAGAYNTERAAAVVGEFDELVREIQGKAAAPFASADHMLSQDVELGETKSGPEGGWPISGRPWTSKPLRKPGVKTQKRIGEAREFTCSAHGVTGCSDCLATKLGGGGQNELPGQVPCACGAATVGAWSGQGVHHGAHTCARVVDTSRATGPARNPHSITNRD